MIIRGGENIYPPEVEEFLHHHPDVAEVAVAGLPDLKYGEIVAAWVVPRNGSVLSPDDVRAYCRGRIAHFKIPSHVDDRPEPAQDRHRQGAQARPQGAGDRRARAGGRGEDRDGVNGQSAHRRGNRAFSRREKVAEGRMRGDIGQGNDRPSPALRAPSPACGRGHETTRLDSSNLVCPKIISAMIETIPSVSHLLRKRTISTTGHRPRPLRSNFPGAVIRCLPPNLDRPW